MKKTKLVAILLLSLALVLLVAQNTAPLEIRFLWLRVQWPAILPLLLAALGGFVIGLLAALFPSRGGRRRDD